MFIAAFLPTEEAVKNNQRSRMLAALLGTMVLFAVSACATGGDAADQAYSEAKNACERQPTDKRESCYNAAAQKYQSDIAKQNASTCPKSTC